MDVKEVDTLFMCFGWIREFILNNGIVRIPEFVAFVLETCGFLYWILIFIFLISLLVGYSRQMSSFYFHYQFIMGQKLNNPYVPSLVIVFLWFANQIFAGGVGMTTVYFIKYGYLIAFVTVIATFALLVGLFAVLHFLLKKINKPKKTEYQAPPQPQNYQAQPQVVHQKAQPDVMYLGGPDSMPPAAETSDPRFEEAIMILGLRRDFTKLELQAQYRKLVKKVHADKGGSDGLYLKVKECYEFLLRRIK